MYIRDCAHCALPQLNGGICPVFRTKPKVNEAGCPMYKETIEYCEICGQPITARMAIDITNDKTHCLCDNCLAQSGTCASCKMRETCEFETNPSTIPKVVQQRVQQGPMTSIIQIKNPTRIDMFCKSCKCFSEEFSCLKENSCCGKWESCYATNDTELQEV